jgi:hypothetical protein
MFFLVFEFASQGGTSAIDMWQFYKKLTLKEMK